jgi:CubicO group peptidase (beta-lactamase class C family)
MKKLLILYCALFFMSGKLFSQDEKAARLETVMDEYARLGHFSGTILLAKDGEAVLHKSYGLADVENQLLNDNETMYNIGSVGKIFTAVMIMQQVEKGALDLHEPIATYLPAYNIPNQDKITLHHLLSHTSGLGNYMRHEEYHVNISTLDEAVEWIEEMPLEFEEPGSQLAYSNSAYVLMGKILEEQSGMDWMAYSRKHLFAPLGMNNTRLFEVGERASNKARGYKLNRIGKHIGYSMEEPRALSDGGLYSTTADLLKFSNALQNGRLISQSSYELMGRTVSRWEGLDADVGYGFEIFELNGRKVLTKGGTVMGGGAEFIHLPDGYSLMMLSNYQNAPLMIFEDALAYMYGDTDELPKSRTGYYIYTQIQQQGFEKVSKNLEAILAEQKLELPAYELRILGTDLLEDGQEKLAESVLLLNNKKFPQDKRTLQALADLYKERNDTAKAQEFEKQLRN